MAILLASCNKEGEGPVLPKTFEGNVALVSQADVDSLVRKKVTHITGHLTIGAGSGVRTETIDPITDLSGLINLSRIDGDLRITRNEELTDLNGLNGLKEVGGDLTIVSNKSLVSAFGLNELVQINGDLEITGNWLLRNIQALDGLKGMHNLIVLHNTVLERLFDFSNEPELELVRICCNPSLISLNGLQRTKIATLFIVENKSLETLRGLEGTTDLSSLKLQHNDNLKTVEGLENLKSVTTSIEIDYNEKLESLDGMGFLERGPLNLNLTNNPSLTSIDRFRLTPALKVEDNWVNIRFNPELTDLTPLEGMSQMGYISIVDTKATELSALSDLTEVIHYSIGLMNELKNFRGLENLRIAHTLFVDGNIQLESLEGLNGLENIPSLFVVAHNEQLTDFCALSSAADQVRPDSNISIVSNASNPSIEDIRNGDCN